MSPSTTSSPNDPPKPFTVGVFCGANSGNNPAFVEAAHSLATVLADNNWHLVYGGGTVGLMGAIASKLTSLRGPNSVHGIVPAALVPKEQEGGIPESSQFGRTTIVKDMHTRKAAMAKEANAFVALPGGFGTLDELFEITTWNQLGIHDRPIILLNIDGFYDGLIQWISKAVETGLISESNRNIIVEATSPDQVAEKIKNYKVAAGRYVLNWESS